MAMTTLNIFKNIEAEVEVENGGMTLRFIKGSVI